jgi:hypothetical protein
MREIWERGIRYQGSVISDQGAVFRAKPILTRVAMSDLKVRSPKKRTRAWSGESTRGRKSPNPRTDLKVGHYKRNRRKRHERKWGFQRGRYWGLDVYTERGCTAGQFVSGTFGEIERKISEGGCVSSDRETRNE